MRIESSGAGQRRRVELLSMSNDSIQSDVKMVTHHVK